MSGKPKRVLCLVAGLFFLLLQTASAQGSVPTLQGEVNDYAGKLQVSEVQRIENIITCIRARAAGIRNIYVLFHNGSGSYTQGKDFADASFTTNNLLGDEVLITATFDPNSLSISTGSFLREKFNAIRPGTNRSQRDYITQTMGPEFTKRNYVGGLVMGMDLIMKVMDPQARSCQDAQTAPTALPLSPASQKSNQPQSVPIPASTKQDDGWQGLWCLLGLLLVVAVVVILGIILWKMPPIGEDTEDESISDYSTPSRRTSRSPAAQPRDDGPSNTVIVFPGSFGNDGYRADSGHSSSSQDRSPDTSSTRFDDQPSPSYSSSSDNRPDTSTTHFDSAPDPSPSSPDTSTTSF